MKKTNHPRIIRYDYLTSHLHGYGFNHNSKRHFFSDKKYGGKLQSKQAAKTASLVIEIFPNKLVRKTPQKNNQLGIHSGIYQSHEKRGDFIGCYYPGAILKRYFFKNEKEKQDAIEIAVDRRKRWEQQDPNHKK